ncbi:MAG: toprim domain-containing protein [Bacteroidales bacterium]|nr:toprim domain-containing protein [Bacteroidales bacterium]
MIDQETIQRIMDAARIEEVIGDFVSLKKRGANHIGCCPFHNEKTPSFYVSPSKGIFKCFGCGEAGDVVAFLKKHEHFNYPEALRYLANKYNIEIREEEMNDEQKEKQNERDALFHLSEFAQKHFADLLYNDEMGRAVGLSYLRGRGLSDEVIKTFGLGYCLDQWNAFTDHARRNGYSDEVLEKTGLTIFKDFERSELEGRSSEVGEQSSGHTTESGKERRQIRRSYDRFRGRVMFPIYSISGRVLGFSGRVLTSEKQAAKYVNSPDSDIYNKSRTLYGLYQARTAISRANKCYLVEGNIDVISMYQSGVQNTVASCGTSLTTEQIRLIKRYTPNVTVLYDGDAAGIKAALRAVDLLFAEGMHVRVVLFPDGDDPDSYAQKYGSTQLQEYLATHEDNFIMYKTRVQLDAVKGDPIRRAELLHDTATTIALVTDMMERQEYIRQCAYLLNTSEDALTSEVAKAINQNRQKSYEAAATTESTPAPAATPASAAIPADVSQQMVTTALRVDERERHIIALLLNYGDRLIADPTPGSNADEQGEYPVATWIVTALSSDGLSFSDPRCQKIYEYYCYQQQQGLPADASIFVTDPDDAVRDFAISLMVDTHRVSNNWWNLKHISVPSIEDNLQQDVWESILLFKAKYLDDRIDDNARRFRSASPDNINDLLAEKKALVDLKRKIGQDLHYVII